MSDDKHRKMLIEKGLLRPEKSYTEKQYSQVKFDEETIRAIFGHEAAEDEDIERLKRYYVKTETYNAIKSTIPLYILVGHKGVGKSALFKILETEDNEECNVAINIQPDDILEIGINEDDFLQKIRNWKEGLAKIIFRELILSLNGYSGNYNNNKPMKEWINNVTTLIGNMFGKKLSELQNEYLDMPNAQIVALFKNALFKGKKVTVYLDDLDRGWKNSTGDIANLSAMLNAVRDLSRDTQNLKFRIALRSDVYYSIRTSDETTDKIDGSVLWLKWTNHEILVMLIRSVYKGLHRITV